MDDGDAEAASAPADPNQSESFKRRESESFQRQWHWRQEGEEIVERRDLKARTARLSRCTIGGEEVLLIAVFDGYAPPPPTSRTELLPRSSTPAPTTPASPARATAAAAFDLAPASCSRRRG